MGAGKTVISLAAIAELLAVGYLSRILVIAPKKVCDTVWATEHLKWDGCVHMTVATATGNEKQRHLAVTSHTNILVINYENVIWFLNNYGTKHDCDGLVIDELSKLKRSSGAIFKRLRRRLAPFVWRVGMTGTPVAENYQGLYAQVLLLDDGKALGTNKADFLASYFYPLDYMRYNWDLLTGGAEAIAARIKDLVYTVPDYRKELPPIRYHEERVQLPKEARFIYDIMRRAMVVTLDGSNDIAAVNSAVQSGKLSQIASGFIYDTESGEGHTLHAAKLEKLVDVLRRLPPPVIVVYWYANDLELLKEVTGFLALGEAKHIDRALKAWNGGELTGLLLHPRSAGHGLNLAEGGSTMVWYGPQWSRDLWEQTNARIWRTGQTETVNVYTIIADDTTDDVMMARVENKAGFDKLLMKHLLER